ncbi:ejaculatory bulb-specific protein 3 [Neodiprion pinetum]|uniref:ejaculatory bulb-specific protein 3 n=1 Tax=Neodiprion pinetum TaxID=441929 RepID=UPI003720C22E
MFTTDIACPKYKEVTSRKTCSEFTYIFQYQKMAKFEKVCAFVIVLFGVLSICQCAGVDDLLNDSTLVRKQLNCVLDKGPCDAIGVSVKASIREVLINNCRNCNQQQAANARRVMEFVRTRYPAEWNEISRKYVGSARG